MYPFTGTLLFQSMIIDAVPVDAVAAVPVNAGLGNLPTTVATGWQDLVALLLPGFASEAHEGRMGGRHFGRDSGGGERMADGGCRIVEGSQTCLNGESKFRFSSCRSQFPRSCGFGDDEVRRREGKAGKMAGWRPRCRPRCRLHESYLNKPCRVLN